MFCVCDSGKKVGLGLGNLPAQDVQPVKTCHDASGIDRCITGELHLLLAAILPFVTTWKVARGRGLAKISEQLV